MLNYSLIVLKDEKLNLSGRKRMDQEDRGMLDPKAQEDRRAFLRRAGKAGIGIPATALLLSVTDKKAKAWGWGYGHNGDHGDIKEKLYKLKEHFHANHGDWNHGDLREKIHHIIQKHNSNGID